MSYCTSIHCMDGRIQEPIRKYLTAKYNVKYVDAITDAGPCKILAEDKNRYIIDSIHFRVGISLQEHKSTLIVISGHHDCAGNPVADEIQKQQIRKAIKYLQNLYSQVEIAGFWIDHSWEIEPV
ncbi:MAG: hypothetical protein AMJ53_00300 [Gammaproteobacteria bacterium SG8_11]|nr:MAG: hypothetical protein AMJ53_00300 [Gammaproteobacteria bacterium SG8_11]